MVRIFWSNLISSPTLIVEAHKSLRNQLTSVNRFITWFDNILNAIKCKCSIKI